MGMRGWMLAAVGWGLIGFAPTRAQILVDAFQVNTAAVATNGTQTNSTTSNVTINGSPATRLLSAQTVGSGNILTTQVLESTWIAFPDLGGDSGSATAALEYSGFSLDLGSNTLFEITFGQILGPATLGIVLQNTGQNLTLSGQQSLSGSNFPNSYTATFDLTTLPGYSPAFLAGVDRINVSVAFDQLGEPTQTVATNIQFAPPAAIPEPSAMALFFGGAALLAVWRRWARGKPAPRAAGR